MARKIVEVVILATIFIIVAGCFSIPIIIYATDSRDIIPSQDAIHQLDISDCSQQVCIGALVNKDIGI